MLDTLFQGLFDGDTASVIPVGEFLLCLGTALVLGALLALSDLRRGSSRSFLVTLAILPAVVCVVIMMVNGNVGAGVAVAGAFSLVRFRSAPGSAREISMLFLAMGAGLITGMGYLGYGVLFTALMGAVSMLYNRLAQRSGKGAERFKAVHSEFIKTVYDIASAVIVFLFHRFNICVAVFERLDSRILTRGGGAHYRVLMNFKHRRDNIRVSASISQSPTCHRVTFRKSAYDNGAFVHSVNFGNGNVSVFAVCKLCVDLVGHYNDIGVPQNLGNCLQIGMLHNSTRGIVREGQYEHFCFLCNGRPQPVGGKSEAVLFFQLNVNGLSA